jgi:hypothetical protein
MSRALWAARLRTVLKFPSPLNLNSVSTPAKFVGMKILTDDPDWKRDVYEARALAMTFVGRYGRVAQGGRQATGNGLTVTYHPDRSPLRLTIDARGVRVLSVEWNPGDAWRMEIETYDSGRWRARLKAVAHPRPWLERWRSLVTFTGTLPRSRSV